MDQNEFNLNWDTFNDHLREMFKEMLNGKEYANVILVGEDKIQFKAHKIVLSACSQVFRSMISVDSLGNLTPLIYLRGIKSNEIKSILEFIYLGQATVNQDRVNEFLNVAKGLEIKNFNKDVNNTDAIENTEQNMTSENEGDEPIAEIEFNLPNSKNYMEEEEEKDNNQDSKKYQCDQCDKHYMGYAGNFKLMRH